MATRDAQRSEAHHTTGDASTSPAGSGDQQTTRVFPGQPADRPPKLPLDLPADVNVVRDDTDAGGPLVIESADPDLNPPRTPKDPFPTERTPEIDPTVGRAGNGG